MADAVLDEPIYVNGIDAATGGYFDGPFSAEELAPAIQRIVAGQDAAERKLASLAWRTRREPHFRAVPGLDESNLAKVGWAVLFAGDADPRIKAALCKLLQHRREQAGDLYREYEGEQGYRKGEAWQAFQKRHHISSGQAIPSEMPYYVLIVGDPETIPFSFQQQLDVQRAVGRLFFANLNDYAMYAESVLAAEQRGVPRPRRATLFGTCHPDDPATMLSDQELVEPLLASLAADEVRKSTERWDITRVGRSEANKDRLASLLGGGETPALLFTATHGAAFDHKDPLWAERQGALITADYPGPHAWRSRLKEDFYFSAADLAALGGRADVWGLIAIFFACFGAGTPRESDFYHLRDRLPGEKLALSPRAALSALPGRLLSHPNGGALAVVGHVERAWPASFRRPNVDGGGGADISSLQQLLRLLMDGLPVGLALEQMNSRSAEFATELTRAIEPVLNKEVAFTPGRQREVARLWTANNDARNYVIAGDPAVRLAAAAPAPAPGAKGGRPEAGPIIIESEARGKCGPAAIDSAPDSAAGTPTDAGAGDGGRQTSEGLARPEAAEDQRGETGLMSGDPRTETPEKRPRSGKGARTMRMQGARTVQVRRYAGKTRSDGDGYRDAYGDVDRDGYEDAPFTPQPHLDAEAATQDPGLYAAWVKQVKRGYRNNDEVFRRILNAFLNSHLSTVIMYWILFGIGAAFFITASVLALMKNAPEAGAIFGGLSIVSFLTYFISRPTQALEENLQYITWLGIIYNTYWTHQALSFDNATAQKELDEATDQALSQLKELIDRHARAVRDRPGLLERLSHGVSGGAGQPADSPETRSRTNAQGQSKADPTTTTNVKE